MLSPYQNCPISIYFTYYSFKDQQENDENINNTKFSLVLEFYKFAEITSFIFPHFTINVFSSQVLDIFLHIFSGSII